MKLTKTKKIILLGATLALLTTSIVTPIVLLNKNENNDEKDINKIFKILEEKKDKTIILASVSTNKIIANNQAKIIAKIKTLIGASNLKDVKIEVSMKKDTNISTTAQKIIIKLTKNEISREIKDFLVKRDFTTSELANKDIVSIKNILDGKTNEDLIIILPSSSSGNIIQNAANRNAIKNKLRMLIDPSNTNDDSTHSSLRGTSIEISMSVDAPISTTVQNIIVSISKTNGTTLRTSNTFQVRIFTADEDIAAVKRILDSKIGDDLIINLPSNSTGNIIENITNKNAIIKRLRTLIDSSNTNGIANHSSLRGISIEISMSANAPISTTIQNIIVSISKSGGTTLRTTKTFQVKRKQSTSEINADIAAIKQILDTKENNSDPNLEIVLPSSSSGSIINNLDNKNAIERKVRELIDPSNTSGDANHSSLRGTTITLTRVISLSGDYITTFRRVITITISKSGGKSLNFTGFVVRKSSS